MAVQTGFPLIQFSCEGTDIFYEIRKEALSPSKFETLRKELLAHALTDQKLLAGLNRLAESCIVVLIYSSTGNSQKSTESQTLLDRIIGASQRVFNGFTIDEKSKSEAEGVTEIIGNNVTNPAYFTLRIESQAFLTKLNAPKTPKKEKTPSVYESPPDFSISPLSPGTPVTKKPFGIDFATDIILPPFDYTDTPDVTKYIKKVFLDIIKKENGEFPFHFAFSCDKLTKPEVTAFCEALKKNGLLATCQNNEVLIQIKKLKTTDPKFDTKNPGMDILATYEKIKTSIPDNIRWFFPHRAPLSNVKGIYKDVTKQPELENLDKFAKLLNADFAAETGLRNQNGAVTTTTTAISH